MNNKKSILRLLVIFNILLGSLFYVFSGFLSLRTGLIDSIAGIFIVIGLILYLLFVISIFKTNGINIKKKLLDIFLYSISFLLCLLIFIFIITKIGGPIVVKGKVCVSGIESNNTYFECKFCRNSISRGDIVSYLNKDGITYIGVVARLPGEKVSIANSYVVKNSETQEEMQVEPVEYFPTNLLNEEEYFIIFDKCQSMITQENFDQFYQNHIINKEDIIGVIKTKSSSQSY